MATPTRCAGVTKRVQGGLADKLPLRVDSIVCFS